MDRARNSRERQPREPPKFDDASLAMLGSLLAFTFGMPIQKHDLQFSER